MLDLLFGPPGRRAAAGDDSWTTGRAFFGRRVWTAAGTPVDEDSALTYSAVWCATRILAEGVGMLPLDLYRRGPNDSRHPALDLPQYDLLTASPNPGMGAKAFRESRTMHQVNWPGGFAEIERADPNDPESPPLALWPIHPCRVRPPRRHESQTYPYIVRNNDNTEVGLRASEVLHVPGALSEDGVWSRGVIGYAREAIGGAQSVERHGYAYFAGGAQPRGVIETDVATPAAGRVTDEQRKAFRAEWKEIHGRPDAGEVAIMPPGGKYHPITLSNEDSQFLQTKKFSVAEVARWYRVPAHMLGEFDKAASYASVEMFSLEFVVFHLMPWLVKWEEQCNLKLLSREQRRTHYYEHNVAALLRGDIKSRYEAYRTGLAAGFLTVNQVCRWENLPTIGPAGDVHLIQVNMTTLEALVENGGVPPGGTKTGVGEAPGGASAGALHGWLHQQGDRIAAGRAGKKLRRQSRTLPRGLPAGDSAIRESPNPMLRAAARGVLEDALRRVYTKEAKAAARLAKRPDFAAALAASHAAQGDTLIAMLVPACGLLAGIGVEANPGELVRELCVEQLDGHARARDELTPEAFAERLEGGPAEWARAAADRILGDGEGGE